MSKLVTVLGGGGFIGSHLVKRLLEEGNEVWVADIKPSAEWHQWHDDARNFVCTDLSDLDNALNVIPEDVDEVYLHAANMGGIGFIESEPLACMWSTKITTACLEAAVIAGAKRVFYSSSACAYPVERQELLNNTPLNEAMLFNGKAEYGYGEEKLFGISQCNVVNNHTNTKTRVGVYHNVYGPYGAYDGGREKAPAAIARKVAEAVLSGNHVIDIWGDGEQQRTFCYIDDCVEGTIRLMRGDYSGPVNIGSDELVSINQMVDILEDIAGVKLERNYQLDKPTGVRGRSSDNSLCRSVLDWEPSISLREGLEKTYNWIYEQVKKRN